MAALVIVIAGLMAARGIMIPFLLAAFIALLCAPLLAWLKNKGMNSAVALILVIGGMITALSALGVLIGNSISSFSSQVSQYEAGLRGVAANLGTWLQNHNIDVTQEELGQILKPSAVIGQISAVLMGLSGLISNGLIVILLVAFMLLEANILPKKIEAINSEIMSTLSGFTNDINRYIALKSMISLATGIIVTVMLLVIGVDYALLWGVFAFLLNFVPNIGSLIAAIPPILLALIQLSPIHALFVAGGYLVINMLIGNIIEPRIMGQGLGLSTLVIFVSLLFWGWVLGPVGMLLSVPLTMMIKVALQSQPQTEWIAILLGSEAPKKSIVPKNPGALED
jgi:predicted PurR-regulated permease PerM